ncbi:hypothetical protein Q8A67_023173 [Cirrhinus molitorella]|uniref:Uncharacterized protein n=1 Tax=Cirrhinus molitorella TaxID=172907 RepID=A0AA88P6E0_9TELE|nr:hypothetical protein Q8A67_023173 [Cirrhinus molitorella]
MLFEPYTLAGLSGRPSNGPQKGEEEPLGRAARGKEPAAARQMTVPHAQEPAFPSRSLAAFRLHLAPQLDVSVAASVIVSGLITAPPPALRPASPGLLSPPSLTSGRSARLMEPLTSPLTLNCAG